MIEKTHMDLYEAMIESIQQFPLDANLFNRNIFRLNKKYKKLMKKNRMYLKKGLFKNNEKFIILQKKIKKCIHKKKNVIRLYRVVIDKQLKNLEEYGKINSITIQNEKDMISEALNKPSLMKILSNATLESRHCICNTKDGGTMICCDSSTCFIRWYHCKCVNVNSIPINKWICDRCRRKDDFKNN